MKYICIKFIRWFGYTINVGDEEFITDNGMVYGNDRHARFWFKDWDNKIHWNEYLISIAEYREKRIDEILND